MRLYAGKIACLLSQEEPLKAVVDAFAAIAVTAACLQRVSPEHAYLEMRHQASKAQSDAF
jgi:hypothetical protein